MRSDTYIVTAWWNPEQRNKFLAVWGLDYANLPDYIILQQDENKEGCAATKNKGIEEALRRGAKIVVVLDDDCFPYDLEGVSDSHNLLSYFASLHENALEPQEVEMYKVVTNPPSRGTPYYNRTVKMPVAASLGFWNNIPDLCAPAQLVRGPFCKMEFDRKPVFGQMFPYCGMNVAFRTEFLPWAYFVDLPRVDDIFAGYLFQKEAYRRGYCFNLNGPLVHHSRQSNVWANLKEEAKYLERNETLWSDIFLSNSNDYEELKKLIPDKI